MGNTCMLYWYIQYCWSIHNVLLALEGIKSNEICYTVEEQMKNKDSSCYNTRIRTCTAMVYDS